MRLESKLGIGTGVLVFAMLVSALLVHLRMTGVVDLANQVGNQRQPFIFRMQILRGDLSETVVALESYLLLDGQAEPRSQVQTQGAIARKAVLDDLTSLREHDGHLDLGQDEGALEPLSQKIEDLLQLERQVSELVDRGTASDQASAHDILQSHILPLVATLDRQTATIIRNQKTLEDRELAIVFHADHVMVETLWVATALGALLGGTFSFFLGRRITRSIDLVAARADAIAAGDLTGSPLDVYPDDQIGELARAMQQMQQSLAGIIGTVVHTVGSLTSSAHSMTLASDQVHRRVDQQTQQTQQAATAMQEMSASITEVSRHTQSAAETARAAAQTAHEGGTIVQQMLGSMASIATAVSDTSSTIGLLGEDSVRISQIVTVIETIAHNTNLLALNAAIEAARAGEQGRGFAVVATEVRRLAESTAQATGEISAMVEGIQARTRTAIKSMASGTATVEQGVATTNQAGEALGHIIGMAERVERMITQIAIAASQQAAAADQSSASLDAIHTLSHENLAEMATTSSGIESLRTTASALEHQVERFRLVIAPPASNFQHVRPAILVSSQPAVA